MTLQSLPTLVTEAEAIKRFGTFLEDKELRRARQNGEIGYIARKRTIFYREDELVAFIATRIERDYTPPCQPPEEQNACSSLSHTGSPALTGQTGSIASGMTPELEKSGIR